MPREPLPALLAAEQVARYVSPLGTSGPREWYEALARFTRVERAIDDETRLETIGRTIGLAYAFAHGFAPGLAFEWYVAFERALRTIGERKVARVSPVAPTPAAEHQRRRLAARVARRRGEVLRAA